MSHNIGRTGVALIIIALIVGAAGGFIVGTNSQEKAPVAAAVKYHIKPYTGIGSGVLKHGTLINVGKTDQYQGPESIVGTIDAPGTWQIQEVQE